MSGIDNQSTVLSRQKPRNVDSKNSISTNVSTAATASASNNICDTIYDPTADVNIFAQIWTAIVQFLAGPPVLPNFAFLLLLVITIFLITKTVTNNEELRLLKLSPRRNLDPLSRMSESISDARNLISGQKIPQFGNGKFRIGETQKYVWPLEASSLINIYQNPMLQNSVDLKDPTDTVCDHCTDESIFASEASKRLCIWAFCPNTDGMYCQAFELGSKEYKECIVCANSPTKLKWIYGESPSDDENLPVCVVQSVTKDQIMYNYY